MTGTRCALVAALLGVSGTTASADVFTWSSGDGVWSDHLKWLGPAGQVPNSVLDTAVVNSNSEVTLDMNVSLSFLALTNSATVTQNFHSVFVDGNISMTDADLGVSDSPSLRDLDCDALTMTRSVLGMYGSTVQVDVLASTSESAIIGVGRIELNSTTGDFVLGSGMLWAVSGGGPGTTLLMIGTPGNTARLDWRGAGSLLIASDGRVLDIQVPTAGTMPGDITASGNASTVRFGHPIATASTSRLRFINAIPALPALIEGTIADHSGELEASADGELRFGWFIQRGDMNVASGVELELAVDLMDFHSVQVDADGATLRPSRFGQELRFFNGASSIDVGGGGTFDVDGTGDQRVFVAASASLGIVAGSLDIASGDVLNGLIELEGDLSITSPGVLTSWTNAGELRLAGGSYAGRTIVNEGLIRGEGDIDASVLSNGTIESVGSTLRFLGDTVIFDWLDGTGVVRAVDGDIVWQGAADAAVNKFEGQLFVGNGVGNQEVFEMNSGFEFESNNGHTPRATLNGGRMRARHIWVREGEFTSSGDSTVTTSPDFGGFRLFPGTSATIDGMLSANRFVVDSGANFSGGGEVVISGVNDVANMFDGADLNAVSLRVAGFVRTQLDFSPLGEVSVGGLTLEPTARTMVGVSEFYGGATRFNSAGPVTLGGELIVAQYGDTPIPSGTVYTVVTAPSVTGSFASVDDSGLTGLRRAGVAVHGASVVVTIACLADLDANGVLDINDVLTFAQAFNAQGSAGDMDGNGVFDINDVLLFGQSFNVCGV